MGCLNEYAELSAESGDEYRRNADGTLHRNPTPPKEEEHKLMVLSPTALREAFAHFFHIIETFCGKQDKDEWKFKILHFWEKRSIKV